MVALFEAPHRRLNPLTNEWLLVSPQRTDRPWQGQIEKMVEEHRPQYDAGCYLCPGNARAGDKRNPAYDGPYVFDNDFPALLADTQPLEQESHALFRAQTERGICRVVCFSPRHDWTLAHMPILDIRRVVDVWAEQTVELAERFEWLRYVQVFENKGAMMGCSNPHPHGQIWATEHLPREIDKEDRAQRGYYEKTGRTMISDILAEEKRRKERLVYENAHWTITMPFWAVWPFEVMLMANRPAQKIADLDDGERDALADALSALVIRYDNLFEISFPYSMGFHQAPVNDGEQPHWHLHAHFYPPLLRSATVKKHMVGYEMLATPQRDITAETAAARLRLLPGVRFG
ncbi:MAG: UDP-glucose--hexose-1-phosphate uridylyltransferase [Anaerolineae bacterium]|nr:UDP-glucose--hexose-1-phosphate uridylyltransferase [Anaerolineae bacterium]